MSFEEVEQKSSGPLLFYSLPFFAALHVAGKVFYNLPSWQGLGTQSTGRVDFKRPNERNNHGNIPIMIVLLPFQPDARDFNLLINLLAESQGLPEAIRILALFEHQFAMVWEPQNIK